MWFTLNLLFTISIFFANTATNIPSRWDDVPLSNVLPEGCSVYSGAASSNFKHSNLVNICQGLVQ